MPGKILKTCVVCLAVVGWWGLGPTDAKGEVAYSKVALVGDPAPGTGPESVYHTFERPTLNNAGEIAFVGSIAGPGVDYKNDRVIWSGKINALGLVVREGMEAPGVRTGAVYEDNHRSVKIQSAFHILQMNKAGQVIFQGRIAGENIGQTNNGGVWIYKEGSLLFVPPAAGVDPLSSPDGKGTAAPGTGQGVVFRPNKLRRNDWIYGSRRVAYAARLDGPGVDKSNDSGIWLKDRGSVVLVARTGVPMQYEGSRVVFYSLGHAVSSGVGPIVFYAYSREIDEAHNCRSLWSGMLGSLSRVARGGDTAPGTDARFNNFHAFGINESGQVTFIASFSGPGGGGSTDRGIWSENDDGFKLIARTGSEAPGTDKGVVFKSLGRSVLNGAGQTAFMGTLAGPGIDTSNDRGIWATDPKGDLKLIARVGGMLEVKGNHFIDHLPIIRNFDGFTFNDLGQLAFKVRFVKGGEGIFIASIQ